VRPTALPSGHSFASAGQAIGCDGVRVKKMIPPATSSKPKIKRVHFFMLIINT
jgi:hypothetical protein